MSGSPDSPAGALPPAFVAEVLRVHERYAKEIVESFDICPFARAARHSGAVRREVLATRTTSPVEESLVKLLLALADDERTQVALLIFPLLECAPNEFDIFVSTLRERSAKSPYAMAGFHPDARWSIDTPAKLVMFLRRTPDPTIQLVRYSALEAVKRAGPPGGKFLFDQRVTSFAELDRRAGGEPVSDRIARENRETVLREGIVRFETVFEDIRADRDRSYKNHTAHSPPT